MVGKSLHEQKKNENKYFTIDSRLFKVPKDQLSLLLNELEEQEKRLKR